MTGKTPSGNEQKVIFTIFGAGALGSLVGGKLATHHPVILIGRKKHLSAIQEQGLQILGKSKFTVRPRAILINEKESPGIREKWRAITESIDFGDYDYHFVIVCVKSYQTKTILEDIKFIYENTKSSNKIFFVSLQNGIENERLLGTAIPECQIIGGITTEGVTFLGPGKVYHAGKGETTLGPLSIEHEGSTVAARILNRLFESIGMESSFCGNIYGKIWIKAIVNSSINPITAITGLENGYLLKRKDLEVLAKRACLEGAAVAEAHLIDLACDNPWKEVKKVILATAKNRSSMLQDIKNGKRTEIDCICGVIIMYGKEENLPVPTQCMLHALVRNIELARRMGKSKMMGSELAETGVMEAQRGTREELEGCAVKKSRRTRQR